MLKRWINLEEDPEVVAANDVTTIEEANAELDIIALQSNAQTDNDASGDQDQPENVCSSEQAINEVDSLRELVALTTTLHSIAGKIDDPVLLELAMTMHSRASSKLASQS